MKDLILICSSYKPNTASINRILSMLRGFDELEIKVELVFLYPNDNGDVLNIDELKNVKIVNLWEGHKRNNKVIKYICSFWDAWRYANKLKAGSNVFIPNASEYVFLFVRRKNIKVFHERTEHFDVVPMKPYVLQWLYKKSVARLDGLFVISTTLRDAYKKIGAKNIHIVNMTVDPKRFLGVSKDVTVAPYIAYCGTASNNKDGVDILIKAFSVVHNKYHKYKLYIIGRAPSKNDESGNYELVRKLELEDSVIFTGIIPASKMPKMLKNATIVALARPDSLQAKCGFPTKLGEYLLSENPAVVTRVGDIPLFLEDGKTALIAEPGDVQDFASRVIWALDHPYDAAIIGKNGASVALSHFNYKVETKKIVETIFA